MTDELDRVYQRMAAKAYAKRQEPPAPRIYHHGGGGPRFTDDQVRSVRQAHRDGVKARELSGKYGVSESAIYQLVNRKSYREVS